MKELYTAALALTLAACTTDSRQASEDPEYSNRSFLLEDDHWEYEPGEERNTNYWEVWYENNGDIKVLLQQGMHGRVRCFYATDIEHCAKRAISLPMPPELGNTVKRFLKERNALRKGVDTATKDGLRNRL